MAAGKATSLAHAAISAFEESGSEFASPVNWNLSRPDLIRDLRARLINEASLPNQRDTNNCGPAAFLYSLLTERPDLYVKMSLDLWKSGVSTLSAGDAFKAIILRPTSQTIASSGTNISGLDWMTMGSLAAGNGGTARQTDAMRAVTYPDTMVTWFQAVGARQVASIGQFGTSVAGGDVAGFPSLFESLQSRILLVIDPSWIEGEPASMLAGLHWISSSQKDPPFLSSRLSMFLKNLMYDGDYRKGETLKLNSIKIKKGDFRFPIFTWGNTSRTLRSDISIFQMRNLLFSGQSFTRMVPA